jgi:hypothetical protein
VGDGAALINQDKLGYAGRVLWRGDNLTLGFTYNQGYYSLFSLFNRLPTITENHEPERRIFNATPRLILTPSRTYAAELAVPIINWTIKAEVVYTQSEVDIGVDSVFIDIAKLGETEIDELYEWIVNQNGGRGYVDLDTLFVQAGFGADYDAWEFGVNFILFENILDSAGKEANRLYKRANPGIASPLESGEEELERIPFPTIYIFYNFGEEDKHRLGFVGGFTGLAAGASIFYTGPIYLGRGVLDESVHWTLGADYVTSLSSQLITQAQEQNNDTINSRVSVASPFTFAVRVGANLEF